MGGDNRKSMEKDYKGRKNVEYPVNLDNYTDLDTITGYIAEDNAKAKDVARRFAAINKAERIGLYNVSNNTAKKLLVQFDFSGLNIVRIYDDDRSCVGEELFGIQIRPFDVCDLEDGVVDKIVIMNSNYQSFIVNDFRRWGFVITLF